MQIVNGINGRWVIVCVLLFLQSFHAAAAPESSTDHARSSKGASKSAVACPSTDFSLFIDRFANDERVQRSFTVSPLAKQFLDTDASPEPKIKRITLTAGQIGFPVIPLAADRKAQSLLITINSVTTSKAKITLSKPDTDYQIAYFFSKEGCWKLERIEDDTFWPGSTSTAHQALIDGASLPMPG